MSEKTRTNVILGLLTLVATFALSVGVASAQDSNGQSNSAPDNTTTNRAHSQTADQQKEKASDRIMTQQNSQVHLKRQNPLHLRA
jgi:hypothetical protein